MVSKELISRVEALRNKPHDYHFTCYGHGTTCLINEYRHTPTMVCPYATDKGGNFTCKPQNPCGGELTGIPALYPSEEHENWMLDKVLKVLQSGVESLAAGEMRKE